MIILDEPPRKNPQRPGRGTNPCFEDNPIRLNPVNEDVDDDDNDAEENDINLPVPEDVETAFMKANRVYYVVLGKNSRVSRCQGCHMKITEAEKKYPICYFHSADMSCLKQIVDLLHIKPNHLYMSNDNFQKLTQDNIKELKRRYHWDGIVKNRRSVRLTGDV